MTCRLSLLVCSRREPRSCGMAHRRFFYSARLWANQLPHLIRWGQNATFNLAKRIKTSRWHGRQNLPEISKFFQQVLRHFVVSLRALNLNHFTPRAELCAGVVLLVDLLKARVGDVGVDLRGVDVRVPQEHLYDAQVHAAL